MSSPSAAAVGAQPNNKGGAHDEHLFIIIHQTFELWFKQVLWELDDARRLLNHEYVPERSVAQVIGRLTRVGEIFRLLVDQFTILETMSPLGFLEFRDYLFPASGFQSLQWRKIEQGLGLEAAARADYGERKFCAFLNTEHQKELRESKDELPSLHDLVGRWLERTPFTMSSCSATTTTFAPLSAPSSGTTFPSAAAAAAAKAAAAKASEEAAPAGRMVPPAVLSSLWDHYRNGVAKMIEQDKAFVREQARAELADQHLIASSSDEEASLSDSPGRLSDNSSAATEGEAEGDSAHSPSSLSSSAASAVTTGQALLEAKVKKQIEEIDVRCSSLATILDSDKFEAAQARGEVRFSHRAMQSALLITLYQDEPILHQASRLLRAIVDIDELMTLWRQRHSLMVHRMIGVKMGTGGSSGFHYLTKAAATHRVFKDLFNISSFLIPRHELPPLPPELRLQLAFVAEAT
jgi:tryptophan 2,3-dioxygenase